VETFPQNICISIQNFPYGKFLEVNEIALAGYEIVLDLRQDNPPKRAQTLNNRGSAYSRLAEMGVEPEVKSNLAINDYCTALKFFNPNTLAADCLRTGRILGNSY
jgi:hypothetical protein